MEKESDPSLVERIHFELNQYASKKLNSAEIANIDREFSDLNLHQKIVFENYRRWIDVYATPKKCLAIYVGQIFKNDDIIYETSMKHVVPEFSALYNFFSDFGVDIFGHTHCTFGRFSVVVDGHPGGLIFLTEK